jgi:LCP family protein required for cell wall assembly
MADRRRRATRPRRTWPQRCVLSINLLLIFAAVATAGGVWWANHKLGQLKRVTITHLDPSVVAHDPGLADVTIPPDPGPLAAQNFLLVGSDSRACIDPKSPYAGAFLNDVTGGDRSDTIMLVRLFPNQDQAAILSLPRDLWVKIAGTGHSSKINSAYNKQDPNELVQTIELNFGIRVDHYVDVDFCAFKNLVDTVGGVRVPFQYPTRDTNTGLNIPAAGCYTFSGDEALAYVRSRHYQYFDGFLWKGDPSSDYGRIARQQDFIKRMVQKAVDKGARNPAVMKDLLDAAWKDVTVDSTLTLAELYDLASKLRSVDPASVPSYRLDGVEAVIAGQDAIRPMLNTPTTKAVLTVFRGQALLAPGSGTTTTTQPGATSTTSTTVRSARTTTTKVPSVVGGSTTTIAEGDLPTVTVPAQAGASILPPDDPTCH